MADIVKIITNAFETYKQDWRKVVAPFLALFVISLLFGVATFLLKLPGPFCGNASAQNSYLVLAFCYLPEIAQAVMGLLEELVSYVIIMAAIIPLWELSKGKKVSEWTPHLTAQLPNAVKVILFRIAINLFIALPIIAFVVLNIGVIVAAVQSGSGMAGLLTIGSIGVLIAAIGVMALLAAFVNFLLTFLEVEMAVGGNGLRMSVGKSYHLVMSNFADVFLFNVVWWLIGAGLGFVKLIMCCTVILIPLMIILNPLIVKPVEWTSKLMLWEEIGGGVTEKGVVKRKKK